MSRENSPQKDGGPYLYSCGKQGKYLLTVDMNVKSVGEPIIDISHHKKNLKSIDKRFERLQKKVVSNGVKGSIAFDILEPYVFCVLLNGCVCLYLRSFIVLTKPKWLYFRILIVYYIKLIRRR